MTAIFILLPLSIAAFVLVFGAAIVHELLFGDAPEPSAASEDVYFDAAELHRQRDLPKASRHDLTACRAHVSGQSTSRLICTTLGLTVALAVGACIWLTDNRCSADEWEPPQRQVPPSLREPTEIDDAFSDVERRILNRALEVFYARIVSFKVTLNFNREGGNMKSDLAGKYIDPGYLANQDEDLRNYRSSMLSSQQGRIEDVVFTGGGRKFPKIVIHAKYASPIGTADIDRKWGNAVAWAPVGSVHVVKPKGGMMRDSVIHGDFELTINRFYLGNTSRREYSDAEYWAGVIAHEIIHNLGHKHPSADDPLYHLYQINIFEHCLRFNGRYTYGSKCFLTRCGCR